MAMSKRDESNKEKTPSSYNLPSTPIPSAPTTINTSQPASTTTNIANAYQQQIQFPNTEGPRATSHLPLSEPRSTNQGLKNDAQAVADLLALFNEASNSPPSYEENPRPNSLKRPPSPPSPPDAGNKKRKLTPSAIPKRSSRTPTGEQSIQWVQYSPKPPQPKRKSDVILDEPPHSTPSPGIIASHVTRLGASSAVITTPFQPPHMRTASYTQISTIAPGPFSPTAAPQQYMPHVPPPSSLSTVPASANIAPQSPLTVPPWPAVTPTSYQIPPTLPSQQYFAGPQPLSLEQLMYQRLALLNYPSGIEYRLIKSCLPDQPLNFFMTNVPPTSPPQSEEPPVLLRPFREPMNEAPAAILESLPHLPQLIQTLEVPFDAQRSAATQPETTRGPPKKLPLHLVQ